ncbi:MAG: hypothetical protein U0892_06675 [Pirellulales bacterium]
MSNTIHAAKQAQGSPANHNTHQTLSLRYANCGRWQSGATNFVVVSDFDIVLASWRNYNREAAKDKPWLVKVIGETEEDYESRCKNETKQFLRKILNPDLRKFLESNGCYVHNVQNFTPFEDLIENNYNPDALYSVCKKVAAKLTSGGKLLFIVPDCHITAFRGWLIDGFTKPDNVSGESDPTIASQTNINGAYHEFVAFLKNKNYATLRASLDDDFQQFVSTAQLSTTSENIIQLGDLYDNWHIQWMYEFAFDKYAEQLVSPRTDRFPIELLDNRDRALDEKISDELLSNWALHFPKYLNIPDSEIDKETGLIRNWHTHVCMMDVIAIVFWGYGLDAIDPSFTCLHPDEFIFLKTTLQSPLNWVNQKHIPTDSLDPSVSLICHVTWKYISKLRASVGAPENEKDMPFDILDKNLTEDRIRKVHKNAASAFSLFQEKKNYIRGNHDTSALNEYLQNKFSNCDLTARPEQFVGQKDADKILDDKEVLCPSEITIKRGEDDRILIEHGDAWDRQNNDCNYYRFVVGHPWFDTPGDYIKSGAAKMVDADDGGYHMPKTGYNEEQATSPNSLYHWAGRYAGDFGLEPPTELRVKALFLKSSKTPRLVIAGHTHLPKLESIKIEKSDVKAIENVGAVYIDSTLKSKYEKAKKSVNAFFGGSSSD